MMKSTEELRLEGPGCGARAKSEADRYARLLLEAAGHIEELERGLMDLARLPVQAHTERLALLHALLDRCGQGIAGELKVASALRMAGLRQIGVGAPEPFAGLAD